MKSEYDIMWADPAKLDLERHIRYIAERLFVPKTASKMKETIKEAVGELSYWPQRFPRVLDENKNPIGEYRHRNVKNYAIVYLIDEKKHLVNVVRIFHSKQSWHQYFLEEETE